jgi:creatinine amidohydrolase
VVKIKFDEMRWPEVEELLAEPHVVILPIGSTEQHGRHLPLNTDTMSAVYFAEQVANRVSNEYGIRVVVAPTIPYGETGGTPPFSQPLPGTISITGDTVLRLIEDVVRSLVTQGFKNILVLNGHLENTTLIAVALRRVSLDFPDAGLYGVNWFHLASDAWNKIRKGSKAGAGHSCEKETSICLALQPQNVALDEIVKGARSFSLPDKYIFPMPAGPVFFHSRVSGTRESGVMGDPSAATKEAGEKLIAAVLDALAEIVVGIAKSEGMKHEEKP